MVERNHPLSIDLPHQPGVDPVLWVLLLDELVAADELGGVGAQYFNANINTVNNPTTRLL